MIFGLCAGEEILYLFFEKKYRGIRNNCTDVFVIAFFKKKS